MAYDPETAERVRRYLAGRDDVVEKRMVGGGLSFLVGGRMCCGVAGTRLMLRLGADCAGPALAEPHVRPMELGGQQLAAFVLVDPPGYADDAALAAWIDRALSFLAAS